MLLFVPRRHACARRVYPSAARRRRATVPVLAACAALLATAGCGKAAREPRPLGALPSAVTSAEPLFLPFAVRAGKQVAPDPREVHFRELRRVTFDGEARAAVWAPDGHALLVESAGASGCGSVARLDLARSRGELTRISPSERAAFTPAFVSGDAVLFALAAARTDCPTDVGRSLDFRAPRPSIALARVAGVGAGLATGSAAAPLEELLAGDAGELAATRDGELIVFTSARDGNPELYRAASDGSAPVRLTERLGYDGMASVSPDGTRIAWQAASEPAPESPAKAGRPPVAPSAPARPAAFAIMAAGSAGQHPVELVAARGLNLGPSFFPDSRHVLFASDREATGERRVALRDFELFAVDPDGPLTVSGAPALERITFSPGFDGWARFSPDGRYLAFTSNRGAESPGDATETDIYIARWSD